MGGAVNFAEVATNAMSGGLLGLVGALGGQIVGIFQRRSEHKMKMEEMRLELEVREKEIAGELEGKRIDQTTRREEAEGRVEERREQSFAEAVRAEAQLADGYIWVTAVKALTRPGLTLLLLTLTTAVYFSSVPEVRQAIGDSIVVTTSTAVLYWFGQRHLARAGRAVAK